MSHAARWWSTRPIRTRDRIVGWMLTLMAAAPRLWDLGRRPLHHDEGSNAIFILRLVREGIYRYDPANYHGPLLYYLSAAAIAACGATTVALRVVPALLGTLLAPLAWALRETLGRVGAATGALLLAVSPSLVYYSRDDIHEIYFVTLTLAMVVCLDRARRSGRLAPMALAGSAAGGLIATKETAPIVFGSILFAAAASWRLGRRQLRPRLLLAYGLPAFLLAAALYSRGFSDPVGLLGPLEALRLWGNRATAGEGHEKPWWYFLDLLAREEGPVVAAALIGAGAALVRRSRSGLFVLAWSATTLLAYSVIPYKTPWLVLNVVLPLALLAGGGFDAAATTARRRLATTALLTAALAVVAGLSLHRAIVLSFVRYDDDRIPLVYVQTRRDALRLVARIEEAAAADPEGRDMPIEILSPDYLPLNWYLREFTNVAYHGHLIENPDAPVVIVRADAADEVAARFGPGYDREEFDLRPGVRLCLFLRPRRPVRLPSPGPRDDAPR